MIINYNILNKILNIKSLKEWQDKMKDMNKEYKKVIKVDNSKTGEFMYIRILRCMNCNVYGISSAFYNYRIGLLSDNDINMILYIKCNECKKKGGIRQRSIEKLPINYW